MDVAQAVAGYINRIVSPGDTSSGAAPAKMKVLLLDKDTVPIV